MNQRFGGFLIRFLLSSLDHLAPPRFNFKWKFIPIPFLSLPVPSCPFPSLPVPSRPFPSLSFPKKTNLIIHKKWWYSIIMNMWNENYDRNYDMFENEKLGIVIKMVRFLLKMNDLIFVDAVMIKNILKFALVTGMSSKNVDLHICAHTWHSVSVMGNEQGFELAVPEFILYVLSIV